MDVFKDLSLSPTHRGEKKVVQLVRNFEEREAQVEKILEEYGCIFGQLKEDGVYCLAVIVDNNCRIYSRTGNRFTNVQAQEEKLSAWAKAQDFSGILISELCNDSLSLEQLGGIVSSNRVKPLDSKQLDSLKDMRMSYHDMLTLEEFIAGESKASYHVRLHKLSHLKGLTTGKDKVLQVEILRTIGACQDFADFLIAREEEGAVFKDPRAGWLAGRKNEVATKLVSGYDTDLEVIGIETGKGKRANTVAKLVVRWRLYGKPDGNIVELPVDGRFNDEQRKEWFDDPSKIIGKIVHVHALKVGSKGSLRIAKVRAVRFDKTFADL